MISLSSFGLSFFSTRSPLSPPSPFSSLPNSVNLCVFQMVETRRELITGWICLSLFHFPLLSSWPPLSPSSLFSSLYNFVNISERSRLWSTHKEVITGWLALSFFDSTLSYPDHFFLPPPSSLLYVTLGNSLGVPHCGETFHL